MDKKFQGYVDDKNILGIRVAIKTSLLFNPDGEKVTQMLEFAESKLGDIYDKHNGELLETDESKFTEEYMDMQMVEMVDNFSKERIENLKKVCKVIYKDEIERKKQKSESEITKQTPEGKTTKQTYTNKADSTNKKDEDIMLQSAIAVAGGIGVVVGVITEAPIITAAGAVALVGGGAWALHKKGVI